MSDIEVGTFEGDAEAAERLETVSIFPSDEDAKKVKEYVLEETVKILDADETKSFFEKLKKWRRQREGRPETENKSYPWPNASNVSVPISMMNANGIFAMMKASFGRRKPFFQVMANQNTFAATAEALTKLLNIIVESPNHVNLPVVNNDILYNVASLGNQFVKVPWIFDRWQFKRTGPGNSQEVVTKIRRNSPAVIPIRHEDFICRPFYDDLQRAPLVGQRIYLMEHELKQRAANGIYENVEEVLKGGMGELDESRKDILERIGITADEGRDMKLYEIHEVYLFHDVDGDGIPEDIIIWIDPITETILRSEFNELGVRPFVNIGYLNRPNELYSIGTGWMSEHLQDEIDALHNMRINSTHLSSLQMFITRRGSGIADNTEFRPLLNIQVSDPGNDFIPISFPNVSSETLQAELLAKEYADRVTGASDAMMGFESQTIGSRATASGTMFLAQQGSKLFNAIQTMVEASYGELARMIVFQLINHKDTVESLFLPMLSEEDAIALQPIFDMNVEDIPTALQFSVKTTSVDQTEEAKRQMKLTLTQLYTMYGEKVFQMLPMIYNPQVPPEIQAVAAKFFIGSTKMMEDVFETFNEHNTDSYLPYIRDIEMMVENMEAMKDQQIGGMAGVRQNRPGIQPQPAGGGSAGGANGQPQPGGQAPQETGGGTNPGPPRSA